MKENILNKTLEIKKGEKFPVGIFKRKKDEFEKPKRRKVSEIKVSELDKELYETCKEEDVERVKELIEAGADVNMRARYGITPLMVAYDEKIIRLLVEKGADIEAVDNHRKNNVLFRTLSETNLDTYRKETEKGYEYVKTNRHIEKFKLLIELGADLKSKNASGNGLLEAAMIGNYYEALKVLISVGVKE
jgi:ankyrin repeat protein